VGPVADDGVGAGVDYLPAPAPQISPGFASQEFGAVWRVDGRAAFVAAMERHHQDVDQWLDRVDYFRAALQIQQIVRVGVGSKPYQSDHCDTVSPPNRIDGDQAQWPNHAESNGFEVLSRRYSTGGAEVVGVVVGQRHVSEAGFGQARRQVGRSHERVAVAAYSTVDETLGGRPAVGQRALEVADHKVTDQERCHRRQ